MSEKIGRAMRCVVAGTVTFLFTLFASPGINSTHASVVCCLNPFPHVHELSETARLNSTSVAVQLSSHFELIIDPGATLAANADALAAFERAADQWRNLITTPVTVTITADLASMGPGVLGTTQSVILGGAFDAVRAQLVANAAGDPNKAIINSLPTFSELNVSLPATYSLQNALGGTKANLKAIGVTGLDEDWGVSDGTINFNSDFDFYYGTGSVPPGQFHFETVAAHEIGHLLGFTSIVDSVDIALFLQGTDEQFPLLILDLFRFATQPGDEDDFRDFARELRPGMDAILADLDDAWAMSTGAFNGDGFQASHWLQSGFAGTFIGMMDPALAAQEIWSITAADLRAMELIGWNVIPEPAALAILLLIALALLHRHRRTAAVVLR